MGNSSSKDGHGPAGVSTGAHLDTFHTPPMSPVTQITPGVHLPPTSTPGQQGGTTPRSPKVAHQAGSIHSCEPSQGTTQEWAVIDPAGTESVSFGKEDCGEAHPASPVTALTQSGLSSILACTSEVGWQEKDSGLDQSAMEVGRLGEGNGNEATVAMETLLQQYQVILGLSHGQDVPLSPTDLLRHLLMERDQLADEVQSLKDTMRAERDEWLQFQSDLQVAVAVADRLRSEAIEELGVLRGAHQDVEQQLATAQQRLEETAAEMKALRTQYQEACDKLSSLARDSQRPGAHGESAVTGRWLGGEPTMEPDTPGTESQGTDRGHAPLKTNKGEEVAVGEKGMAEAYPRSVVIEGKGKEESHAGREPHNRAAMVERSRSLSRLSLSSDSPVAVNGTSQPIAVIAGSLSKNPHPGHGKKVEQALERQPGWAGASMGRREVTAASHQNVAPSDLPLTGSKVRPQDGFSTLLRQHGGSKRNSLLRWCQSRTQGYKNIDITNFSSSWADGLALCAVYHTYLPSHIPYGSLKPDSKRENLDLAFKTGESVGIKASLTVEEMLKEGGPDWQKVLGYIESIYRHFEM